MSNLPGGKNPTEPHPVPDDLGAASPVEPSEHQPSSIEGTLDVPPAATLQSGNASELRTSNTLRRSTFEAHSGPLPHPQILAEYDKVVPGLAKQLAEALATEGAHRRELETKEVQLTEATVLGDLNNQRLGIKLGFSLCLLGLVAATALALAGRETTAVVIAGIEFSGLATAFIARAVKRARHEGADKTTEENGE